MENVNKDLTSINVQNWLTTSDVSLYVTLADTLRTSELLDDVSPIVYSYP